MAGNLVKFNQRQCKVNNVHKIEDEINEVDCKIQNDKMVNWDEEKQKLEIEKLKLIKELDDSRTALITEIKKNNISRLKKINAMFDQ